ncbi:LOW QUALITY PROTEIN: cation-independent mannose-6-phosphate receptor-like [Stegodyphus dumicola]|uniref:LOW QUALITY PROTEIN: cation-independent mannose-6-phosphate receptor-like n=1 Tax=Stegodyphus dumicola TaxID=202533 RepID=UPI0015ADD336|nr:LOW QUALITY PROTEIN: cation-independent mannose-6-phosphate receptor-like [Stegodyphus dumicola]
MTYSPKFCKPGGWPVSGTKVNGTSTYYEISICHPLNYTQLSLSQGCSKSSICQISGEKAVSFGKAIESPSDYRISDNGNTGFSLYVHTSELCGSSGVYQATISFACGPNLGAPELILWSDCQVKFFWRTSAACINKPKIRQVPCYAIDNEGNKRDLSQLILRKGGYSVAMFFSTTFDFMINICSEIFGDEGCGSNSSACRVHWNERLSFGKPHGRLQYTQKGLILSYLTDEIYPKPPKGCSLKPKTTIIFKCPQRNKRSVETCQFTAESNGVEIDLSPLIERPAYNIPSSSGNSTFALSVCVGLQNFACNGKNWNSTSVCANGTTNSSVIIGTTEGSHLIYADDIVILTYPGQASCDNDTDQSSIIKFLCDSDADNDGNGKPYHIFSDPCIHTFEWKTKHACLKPSLDSTLLKWTNYCSAHFKNKTINLARLFLERWHGKVWEATDGRNINPKDNAKYYLNVCGQVAYISHLSSCGEGSSACVLDSSGKYLNLGNFTSPPVYDIISDSVRLTYTGGSPCKDGKRWISTINFFCRFSDLVSRPILVHVDESECQYKFEWHTARACPEVVIEGANCKIHDDNIGINYDLSPLKHKVYKVDAESQKLFIRICEPQHDGFSYIFHWYTSLLCTNSSTVCMVQDPFSHLIYDLSGLSIYENNWVHVVNEDNKESKVYLSICRPLTQPLICDSSAAACMVEKVGGEEKVVISNLGQPVSLPVLESPGHLILKYTNGNPCTEYSENATYSTVIHFLCAKDKMGKNDLTFLSKVGACDYAFLWRTKAACPTSVSQTFESCQLTDPDSGFTFNLTSLWKVGEPYTIKTYFNTTFQLNVCGKVESGCLSSNGKQPSENVSACKIDSEGSVRNLAVSDSYFLSYSTGTDLSITYKYFDESFDEGVIIKFPCHNTTADPHLKFVMYDDKNRQYIFEMKTPLTCIRSHFDCNVFDQYGNEYDLSPLTKYREGNWEVADSRPNHSHLRYHINICRPLNKVNGYKCPTGFSGACQTNVLQNGSIGHDLGSQMNEPLVNDKGNIVLRYTHGSYCNSGQFKRSTTVNLFCFGEHEDLKFIKETPECEYIFSLRTPVACPIQNSISGACTIKDPSFGYIFDLNPLKNKNNYYLTVGEYNFYLNVCDKLNGFKNACMNSSACQTKPEEPSFSISFGLPNDHLVYRNGVLTLEYTSDANYCHGKYSGSIKIIFTCHQALEVGPYFVSETEDCTFLFEWPTVHACPTFNVVECSQIIST